MGSYLISNPSPVKPFNPNQVLNSMVGTFLPKAIVFYIIKTDIDFSEL